MFGLTATVPLGANLGVIYSYGMDSARIEGEAAPTTWLAWPTLREAAPAWTCAVRDDVDIADLGADIGDIQGGMVTVQLADDPLRGEITVALGGHVVAVFDGERSADYSAAISRLGRLNMAATCRAKLDVEGGMTVLKMLSRPEIGSPQAPFLPAFEPVGVMTEEFAPDDVRGLLGGLATDGPTTLLGALSIKGGMTVLSIEGLAIGHLERSAERLVGTVLAAGFHATCATTVNRNAAGSIEMAVWIPDEI